MTLNYDFYATSSLLVKVEVHQTVILQLLKTTTSSNQYGSLQGPTLLKLPVSTQPLSHKFEWR